MVLFNGKSFFARLYLTLALGVSVLLMLSLGVFYFSEKREWDRRTKEAGLQVDVEVSSSIENQFVLMTAIAETIAQDRQVIQLIQNGDGPTLYQEYLDFFHRVEADFGVTHLYFGDASRRILTRVHKQDKYGDISNRELVLSALSERKPTRGIEQWTQGGPAVRVIFPILEKSQVVGFVGIGADLAHIVERSASTLGAQFALFHENLAFDGRGDKWDVIAGDADFMGADWKNILATGSDSDFLSLVNHPLDTPDGSRVAALAISTGKSSRLDFLVYGLPSPRYSWSVAAFLVTGFSVVVVVIAVMLMLLSQWARNQERVLLSSAKFAALGEMAANVAHEINNPLAIISGRTAEIRKYLVSPKDSREWDSNWISDRLSSIDKTVLRISRIIKGLRALSGREEHEPFSTVLVAEVVQDVVIVSADRFSKNGVSLKIDIPGDLAVECRSQQLSQVVLNLLNNAFDAVQELSEKWVHLSAQSDGEHLILTVSDSGKGIPPSIADRMMEPFFTTKTHGKGTGLGLGICQNIVRAHNGKFQYRPLEAHTTFVVTIPLRQPVASAA